MLYKALLYRFQYMTSQSSGEKGIVFYNNDNEAQLALCLEENKSGTHLVLYKK